MATLADWLRGIAIALAVLAGGWAAAASPELPLVQLDFRFESTPAQEVTLVWGVNDWQVPPEEQWPTGSFVTKRLLHSPMQREGGQHRVVIRVPRGDHVDHGFLVKNIRSAAQEVSWHEGTRLVAYRDLTMAFEPPPKVRQVPRPAWFGVGGAALCGLMVAWRGRRQRSSPRDLAILEFRPASRDAIRLAAVNGLGIAAILLGSWGFTSMNRAGGSAAESAPGWVRYGLDQFNLRSENVLASWFSSSLLMVASLACLACFLGDLARKIPGWRRWLGWGWLGLSLGFLALSADEMGSWHETLLNQGDGPLTAWVLTLAGPMAAAAVFGVVFMWSHVRQHRRCFLLMVIATGCYVISPFLGLVDMDLLKNQDNATAIRWHDRLDWIEKGAEMLGSLIFASAALAYLHFRKGFSILRVRDGMVLGTVVVVGVVFEAAFLGVEWLRQVWVWGDTGIPGNWFPSMLALLTAIAAYWVSRQFHATDTRARVGVFRTAMVACLLLSASYGIGLRGWVDENDTIFTIVQGSTLAILALMIVAMAWAVGHMGYAAIASLWLAAEATLLFSSPAKVTWMDIAAMTGLLFLMVEARLLVPREVPASARQQKSQSPRPQPHTVRSSILLVRHRE